MNKNDLLESMKAHSIPAGWSNLWYVSKINISNPITPIRHGKKVVLTPGQYTFLHRLTDGTLHRDLPGEVVMEDTPFELRTHLGFVMQAHGRVLVTGLGLGCVLRGLLSNPAVQHITCIENSRDVLKLVGAHMPRERLTILEADAFEWTAQNTQVAVRAPSKASPAPHCWHANVIVTGR